MNHQISGLLAAIATLSITACQAPTSSPGPDSNAATGSATTETATTAPTALPAGISLSDDRQAVMMDSGSALEVYCSDGKGALAISYVGETGSDGQILGCEATFDTFDAAREGSFAEVNIVAPVIVENALQLQEAEYTKLECRADHAGLSPVLSEKSDGHMTIECI